MPLVSSTTKHSSSLWPRAIAAYFCVAIVGIVTFVAWSVRQNVDLVRADYYAEEIGFQRHLDQINHARALNAKMQIAFNGAANAVMISLPNSSSSVAGNIHFYRPSDAAKDKQMRLSLQADGSQRIDARNLENGLWKVQVTWTANGTEFFTEETFVIDRSRA